MKYESFLTNSGNSELDKIATLMVAEDGEPLLSCSFWSKILNHNEKELFLMALYDNYGCILEDSYYIPAVWIEREFKIDLSLFRSHAINLLKKNE